MAVENVGSRWNDPGWEGAQTFYNKETGAVIFRIAPGGVVLPNPSRGLTYYADGNVGDDNDNGLGAATPFATVTAAMAASHATIATSPYGTGIGGAARNILYIKGDTFAEDLTTLAQKTDIIGVGSHDSNPMATITGNHVIGAAAYYGCRFFNVRFQAPAGGGDLFTVPTTTGGLAFHNCVFDGHNSTKATGALIVTASHMFRVSNCRFIGEYSDAVIELGAGVMNDCIIEGNHIQGVNKGILVNAGLTQTQYQGFIRDNTFFTTLACIDDQSSTFAIIRNNGITLMHLPGE